MERNQSIDMAKGLGILMITYGHITDLGNPVDTWMSLFKITIFYIVAGYLMASGRSYERRTRLENIRHILRNIMIPYISFSLVSIAVRAVSAWLKHGNVMKGLLGNVYATVSMRGISTLWFLPAMAIGEIVFILILKSRSRVLMVLTLIWPVVAGVLSADWLSQFELTASERTFKLVSYPILAVSKGLISVWFLEIGFLGYYVIKRIPKGKPQLAAGILLSVPELAVPFFTDPHINFNLMKLGQPAWLFFAGGVLGSFGALLILEWISTYHVIRPLVYFGKNSLILMAVQRCLLLINFAVAGWKGVVRIEEIVCRRYYLETFLILVLVLLMAYAVIELINKSPLARTVFLGKR